MKTISRLVLYLGILVFAFCLFAVRQVYAQPPMCIQDYSVQQDGPCGVYVVNSQSEVFYRLLRDGNSYDMRSGSTGSELHFTNLPAGTYTVQANIAECSIGGPTSIMLPGSVTLTGVSISVSVPSGVYSRYSGSGTSSYTTSSATASSYSWSLSPAGAGTISGSGNNATVAWNSSFSGTATVSVTGTGCGSSASSSATVTVYPQLIAGNVSPSSQNIASGADAANLVSSAATGGNGTYSYQWQVFNGSSYVATGSSATAPVPLQLHAQTVSGSYRMSITSNGVTVYSNAATVNVVALPLTAGAIMPANQSLNPGSPAATLTAGAATGGTSGSYAYQWESSTNGSTWTAILNATGLSYPPGTVSVLTYYRVKITRGTETVYSEPAQISLRGVCSPLASAPSANQNYVITWTPLEPYTDASQLASKTNCQVMQTIAYFDGLGRPLQTVQTRGSGDGSKDLVQPVAYDEFGREVKKYLPYAAEGAANGSYKTNALTAADGVFKFYNPSPGGLSGSQQANDIAFIPTPFAETALEASPLNRVLEQGAPGDAWQLGSGHTVKLEYSVNTATGDFAVRQFTAAPSATPGQEYKRVLSSTGNYAANELYLTITRDENWITTDGKAGTSEEYKNKEGQVVLKRTFNRTGGTPGTLETLSTYYVYDDLGNLSFVLTPGSGADSGTPGQTIQDNLCYQYRYDERRRLIEKKIPGKDWEYLVYDKLDQLVLSQDGNLHAAGQWLFNKYDISGRVVMSGLYTDAAGRTALQTAAAGTTILWEHPQSTGDTGYSNDAFPQNNTTVHSIQYYDDYTFPGASAYPYASASGQTRGLLTGTRAAVLGAAGTMLLSVNYYDNKARLIKSFRQHDLGGVQDAFNYQETSNQYSFTGQLQSSIRTQYKKNGSVKATLVKIINQYEYDPSMRPTKTWEQINDNGSRVLLSQLVYNAIGQLQEKRLHGGDVNEEGLPQNVSLSTDGVVNAGGSLTIVATGSITLLPGVDFKAGSTVSASIATPAVQVIRYAYNERGWLSRINDPANLAASQAFGMTLQYNTATLPQYNGNIGGLSWQTKVPSGLGLTQLLQRYDYTYDKLNRLTLADYTTPSKAGQFNETLSYDLRGNISSLKRTANATASYLNNFTYDYTSGGAGNKLWAVSDAGTANQSGSYTYDANGNQKTDTRKGITNISYNYLNLPEQVSRSSNPVQYVYDAWGLKLRKISGSTSRDYIDGVEYNNGSLEFIQTQEGRALPGSSYTYEYALKDHLGNTRALVKQDGSISQVQDYYAFGMQMNPGNSKAATPPNQYQYNGKELQPELEVYDYGARFYDPVIGRWDVVDRYAEKYYNMSSYSYAGNNSVLNVDANGDSIIRVQINDRTGFIHGARNLYIDHTFYDETKTFLADAASNGIHIRINSSFRTNRKQATLNGDNAVTPAKPGLSAHNAGLAIDFNLYQDNDLSKGTIPKNTGVTSENSFIQDVKEDAGVRFGGDFKKPDRVHIDKRGTNTTFNKMRDENQTQMHGNTETINNDDYVRKTIKLYIVPNKKENDK